MRKKCRQVMFTGGYKISKNSYEHNWKYTRERVQLKIFNNALCFANL